LADEIHRSNWLPNVGEREGLPLGDMWTFRCPPGGRFSVSVDGRDDTDTGESLVDPLLEVVDGNGNNLAFADDEIECTYRPVCGFSCPALNRVRCGDGDRHSIIVRDYGTASVSGDFCAGGGGYDLLLTVYGPTGHEWSEESTELGGGSFRQLPRWVTLRLPALGPIGPVLDDEDVPNRMHVTK
jgi:hypothetical protein